jgi:hypothetical protein
VGRVSGGVALEAAEHVEVGLGAAGTFGDVGLGSRVAVGEPVDRDQVERGVGLAVATAGEPEPIRLSG